MYTRIFLSILFAIYTTVYGQNSKDSNQFKQNPSYINTPISLRFSNLDAPNNIYKKTASDFAKIFTSPLHWKKNDYIKLGTIVAAASTLYIFDEDIYNTVNRNKTTQTRFTTKYILEPIGNYSTYALLASMAGYGLIYHKERPTSTAILSAESLILASLFVQIPKRLAGRERPKHTHPLSSKEWNGWGGGSSFWSGHTTAAFSVASVIAEMYDDRPTIGFIAYSAATLAGLSRIHDQKHWASDVFMGAVVGTAIGKLVVKSYRSNKVAFTPIITPENSGLYFSFSF